MKYLYQYKTKENERRSGEIDASSREDVYRLLKPQGIRPFNVELAPGFFNKMRSVGKRWMAIIILAMIAVVSSFFALNGRDAKLVQKERRGQIYGDPSVIQVCERAGWTNAINGDFNLMLTKFAQPGRAVEKVPAWGEADLEFLRIAPDDYPEVARMKRMVNWMKDELRAYLKAGGTTEGYVNRLVERQDEEVAIRERTGVELNIIKDNPQENFEREWESRNEMLRKMGIKTFPLPNLPN